MRNAFEEVEGGVVAPAGFLASGVFCDIKRLGTGKGSDQGAKRDLAMLVSEVPSAVAGMFTTNQVCAAPVKVCRERVRGRIAQAVVINSGNANACTGDRGLRDALEMARCAARELHCPETQVLVASTGRIGMPLPMSRVRRGIREAVARLDNTPEAAQDAAEAILTSDTRRKEIALEFTLGGRRVRLGGMAKGAGMIHPGMSRDGRRPASLPAGGRHATMLALVTTDAAVEPEALELALEEAVAYSFNRITVDGDMSTNDTVLALADGLAGNQPVSAAAMRAVRRASGKPAANARGQVRDAGAFQAALERVCLELAKMIVRDGEGVHRVVTVRVRGARNHAEADEAARSVANSPLVKTSWHGGDPNWGRIMDALGYSRAQVREDRVDIGYRAPGCGAVLWSLRRGQPTKASFRRLCRAVQEREFELEVNLNLGQAEAVIYAADLTEAYVEFNKGDVGNPAALGG